MILGDTNSEQASVANSPIVNGIFHDSVPDLLGQWRTDIHTNKQCDAFLPLVRLDAEPPAKQFADILANFVNNGRANEEDSKDQILNGAFKKGGMKEVDKLVAETNELLKQQGLSVRRLEPAKEELDLMRRMAEAQHRQPGTLIVLEVSGGKILKNPRVYAEVQ